MKSALLVSLLSIITAVSARADLIYYEPFQYTNGQIIITGTNAGPGGTITTNWFRHSGTGDDALVNNNKLEVAATSPPAPNPITRQDDVNRPFSSTNNSPYTNSSQLVFASFTVNCTNLPVTGGAYFAHFKDSTTSNFLCKVYGMTPGNTGTAVTNFYGLPNTWRLGIQAASNGLVNQTFPVDLALNTDYQVVVAYDPPGTLGFDHVAYLWVNPLSISDDPRITSDTFSTVLGNAIVSAFAFRQASGAGNAFYLVTNLAVATTFADAASAVWPTPSAPKVVYQPQGASLFAGNSLLMYVVANGQGLTTLNYQWRKDGSPITNPNGNSNIYTNSSVAGADQGAYDVVVTSGNSLSVTSAVASVTVNATPTAPSFTTQPVGATNFLGNTVTLTGVASGSGLLTYQWYTNGVAVANGAVGPASYSGATSTTLTIANANTNQSATYTVVAHGSVSPDATSQPAIVSILPAQPVSIAFLRSIEDPVTWQATNVTTLFNATGVITTVTNLTSGNTSSYFIQDTTAGINLFITSASTFRPQQGDIVSAVGTLSMFNNSMELALNANNTYHSHNIIGHTLLPAPFVFNPRLTNNPGLMETNIEGRFVMLTNVTFPNFTNGASGANSTVFVTCDGGAPARLFFTGQAQDTINKVMPPFAWAVIGVASQAASGNTYSPSNYFVQVTRWADIITNPPNAVTATIAKSGSNVLLGWNAGPYTNAYSVWRAPKLDGAYLPLALGLTFTNTAGAYTDSLPAGDTAFYKVSSP